MLHNGVFAYNANVAHAVLHISDHIRRFGQYRLVRVHRQNQPTAFILQSLRVQPHGLEHLHRRLFQPSLSKCNAQRAIQIDLLVEHIGHRRHIHRKADGRFVRAKFAQQIVIPTAGQHCQTAALHIPAKDHAGVVVRTINNAQIQQHLLLQTCGAQRVVQCFNILQGGVCAALGIQFPRFVQHLRAAKQPRQPP